MLIATLPTQILSSSLNMKAPGSSEKLLLTHKTTYFHKIRRQYREHLVQNFLLETSPIQYSNQPELVQ